MHELAVTQAIVDQVVERMEGRRVVAVHLEIGKLAGIVPDSVKFCFELVTAGTVLEGSLLVIDQPAGRAQCLKCHMDFSIDDLMLLCSCGSVDIRVTSGDQLLIKSVKVVV